MSVASKTSCAQPTSPTSSTSNSNAGDDAEVRPGAAHGPEAGRVRPRRRPARAYRRRARSRRRRRWSIVRPCSRAEQADAAGGRQPADADVAVVAGAERPAVRGERGGHVAPARAGTDAHAARARGRAPRSVSSAPTSMTMPPSLVDRPLMPCPPLRTRERHVLRAGEGQRLARPRRRPRPQDETGGAAAHVGRPHAGVARGRRARRRVATSEAGSAVVVDARRGAWPARPRARTGARRRPGRRALGGDGLAQRRGDLLAERRDRRAGRRSPRMKVPTPSSSDEGEQVLDPLLGGPWRNPARVNDPAPTLSRRRISRGSRPAAARRLVDHARCPAARSPGFR